MVDTKKTFTGMAIAGLSAVFLTGCGGKSDTIIYDDGTGFYRITQNIDKEYVENNLGIPKEDQKDYYTEIFEEQFEEEEVPEGYTWDVTEYPGEDTISIIVGSPFTYDENGADFEGTSIPNGFDVKLSADGETIEYSFDGGEARNNTAPEEFTKANISVAEVEVSFPGAVVSTNGGDPYIYETQVFWPTSDVLKAIRDDETLTATGYLEFLKGVEDDDTSTSPSPSAPPSASPSATSTAAEVDEKNLEESDLNYSIIVWSGIPILLLGATGLFITYRRKQQ